MYNGSSKSMGSSRTWNFLGSMRETHKLFHSCFHCETVGFNSIQHSLKLRWTTFSSFLLSNVVFLFNYLNSFKILDLSLILKILSRLTEILYLFSFSSCYSSQIHWYVTDNSVIDEVLPSNGVIQETKVFFILLFP